MANRTVREFIKKAFQQFYSKLSTDILSTKESSSNKVASFDSSSTNTQYPSAKAVNDKFTSLDGTASIASVTNNIVTMNYTHTKDVTVSCSAANSLQNSLKDIL